MKEESKKVICCSFYKDCENYNIKCDNCTLNAANDFKNYLVIKGHSGKTLRFM